MVNGLCEKKKPFREFISKRNTNWNEIVEFDPRRPDVIKSCRAYASKTTENTCEFTETVRKIEQTLFSASFLIVLLAKSQSHSFYSFIYCYCLYWTAKKNIELFLYTWIGANHLICIFLKCFRLNIFPNIHLRQAPK